jgi:hypothetical protein
VLAQQGASSSSSSSSSVGAGQGAAQLGEFLADNAVAVTCCCGQLLTASGMSSGTPLHHSPALC